MLVALPFRTDATDNEAVRTVMEKHCFRCHGPEKQKSDIRFDTLSTDLIQDRAAAETWHDALHALQLGEMPPEDGEPLSADDRELLTGWIQNKIDAAVAEMKSTGGRVVMRRLNRIEYQNAMVDLLGVDLDYAANLPPESVSGEGFLNNGAVLSMSPLQLEYYLEAARMGLRGAIVAGGEPQVFEHATDKTAADKGKGNYTNRLGRSGVFVARMEGFPDEGEFEIRVKARAELVEGKGFPRMKLRFGYRADTQTPAEDVGFADVTSEELTEFVFRRRIDAFPIQSRTQSKYPGMLAWITNVYDDGEKFKTTKTVEETVGNKKKKKKTTVYVEDPKFPKVVVESFEFVAPVFSAWPPASHREILFESDLRKSDEAKYAGQVIERFMERAYRRPVDKAEVAVMRSYYEKLRPVASSLEEAMREVLAMVLVSPDFLYLVEPGGDHKRRLNDYEFASRLSFFLWASPPDKTLMKSAAGGKLRDPKVLKRQIDRLLDDQRTERFVEQFASQWLDLAAVDRVAVNPEYYEDFDNGLKQSMKGETHAFFGEVLSKNLSALNFLDSDFAMLNRPMAEHYGIENGPRGMDFERVKLDGESVRGGLLTHASVLLGNSTGEDSHPILRAVWLRDKLLDDPPAPPPPNVPDLDAESPDLASLSVREQLELHREDASCADCHKGIDPWGIAMQNYDAIGLWREVIRRKKPGGKRDDWNEFAVDASTELPGGVQVDGLEALKAHLGEEKQEQFSRALTSRLTSYALGRSLEITDSEIVDGIAVEFAANEFRLRDLIHLIIRSELFETK